MRLGKILTIGIVASALTISSGAEIVGWRMDGDGKYPDAQPPETWSPDENIRWKTPMPSWSNASPVLLQDKSLLFVLSEPDQLVAVRTETGKIAWQDSLGGLGNKSIAAHDANGWTTATPVSDGSHVFTLFGSGVAAAHTIGGQRVWARVVQEPTHRWGNSASPVLGGGRLILQVLDLIALDPETGTEAWRAESTGKWGSPIVVQIAGVDVVITPGGDVFRADNGKPIASGIGNLDYATPVVDDGAVYFIEKKATAVRLPETLDKPFETLWESRIQGSRHYASSLIHDGLIYAVSREQRFSILDAKTGELVHERALDLDSGSNTAYPSISLAGNRIFLSTANGTTAVLEPGREYKEIARSSIEGFRSSPVFAGKNMYIRTFENLYCFTSES